MDTKSNTLTRADIETMQAGPEMDALLLERLFTPEQAADIMQKHGTAHLVVYAGGKTRSEVCPPKFSTDIAAAWSVVEHCRARGWEIELVSDNYDTVVPWQARLSFPDGGTWDAPLRDDVIAHGPDAPTAIGRTALLTTVE